MVPFLIIHPLPTCVHTVWTLQIPFCTFWARSSTHCWLVFGVKSARPAPWRRGNERAASRVESSGNVCVKVTDPHGGFHHLCARKPSCACAGDFSELIKEPPSKAAGGRAACDQRRRALLRARFSASLAFMTVALFVRTPSSVKHCCKCGRVCAACSRSCFSHA